jgi:hypothetical protein
VEGQDATFSVTAQGTAPLHYQWTYVSGTTTNVLTNGGRISGATTNSLIISSVIPADAGTYSVTVTNSKGTNFAVASLTVVPLSEARTNYLINPSFEQGGFASSGTAGWFNFSGCAIQSTNDFYYLSAVNVSVLGGTNACQIFPAATWNGIFQDRPASPGQVYTASAWFLTSTNDPITASNTCYLEVQFRNAGGTPLIQYSTSVVDTNFPTDTWINMSPTNVKTGDFLTSLGSSPHMVAPAGTVSVRYQFTYHADGGSGSVYVDAAALTLREPAVTGSLSGANIQLSFATLYGPMYQVYYKTNLTDTTWHTLGSPITGDGTVKTVSDPASAGGRFYIVNTTQ